MPLHHHINITTFHQSDRLLSTIIHFHQSPHFTCRAGSCRQSFHSHFHITTFHLSGRFLPTITPLHHFTSRTGSCRQSSPSHNHTISFSFSHHITTAFHQSDRLLSTIIQFHNHHISSVGQAPADMASSYCHVSRGIQVSASPASLTRCHPERYDELNDSRAPRLSKSGVEVGGGRESQEQAVVPLVGRLGHPSLPQYFGPFFNLIDVFPVVK